MPTRFDRDTAVRPLRPGVVSAVIDPGWFVVKGPNGGYVAAILLRALRAAVDDPARAPRSLTAHYIAPPAAGPVEIHTAIERSGRSLTNASARMLQEGKLVALALAAFSKPREALCFDESTCPQVPAPEECPRIESRIPMHDRYESRRALGPEPFSGAERAEGGGWIRLAEGDRALDAPLVAAYADAWPPAMFARLETQGLTGGIPTVDLTVHFRETLGVDRDRDYALAVFRSRRAHEGFLEEDGEIWSRNGRLLAHSRQLAVIL
jgi:acyl-CoA thioesterase